VASFSEEERGGKDITDSGTSLGKKQKLVAPEKYKNLIKIKNE